MLTNRLFGREREVALLDSVYASGSPEFVAIYGRRRIGKTYLIREYFEGRGAVYFEFTGQKDAALNVQLNDFRETLEKVFYSGKPIPRLDSWKSAFKTLAEALRATQNVQKAERAVVILDELPWMATPKSGLIPALDHIWNTQLSTMPEVILVVCGSAASWMIDHLIQAKGGLHNRITRRIRLMPFTLPESISFLKSRHIKLSLRAAAELYMAIGGVPYYLNQIDKRLSVSQNIASLCFSESGVLRTEFTSLFRALFGESDIYEKIVRTLAKRRGGVSRTDLLTALKAESGGSLNRKLGELEEAGFIARITPYDKRKKNALYRIIDPYVYFYLAWIEKAPNGIFVNQGEAYWLDKIRTSSYQAWAGYTFENLCLTHAQYIQKALRLDHIPCDTGGWNHIPPKGHPDQGAQIDLLFDRADDTISLCEIKFNAEPFSIDKTYAKVLQRKLDVFQTQTQTRKTLQLVLITFDDFKPNIWSEDLIDVAVDATEIFGGHP
jgi:uncharacterized protein